MKLEKKILIIIHICFVLYSCKQNKWDIEVENKDLKISVVNVDSLLFNSTKKEVKKIHDSLTEALGEMYLYEVSMNTQAPIDSETPTILKKFYENEYINELESEKEKLNNQVDEQFSKLNKAFNYLLHHFPEVKTPSRIVLMNNLFSGISIADNEIYVGLEKYLDPTSDLVKNIPDEQLHKWQKESMNIEFLARDILIQWIQTSIFDEKDEHLAFHIIQAGKVLTVLQACFPNETEEYIMRYNSDEINWAVENEQLFWEYLVKEEMLFKNNPRDKTNFLNEGPYTVGLPEKGPDRMGQFLGLQMAKSYLKSNKKLSLQEFLEVEYNAILQAYEI